MRTRIISQLRNSLSVRLGFWVAACVTAIFIAALNLMFTEIREVVEQEAMEKATERLDGTVLRIENTLRQAEVAANNMLRSIEQDIDKPDRMFEYSRQTLVNNPNLAGCSISFEPYFFKEKGRYFSAYSYNNGDSIQTEQEGTDNYQYFCMDWYLIPKLLNRPYWIEPFHEDADEGIEVKETFSSYSQPIHDRQGRSVGTFSVDFSLDWFSQAISETKPYPNSYSILLGKGGTFIVHPDSAKLFNETIYTRTLEAPDSALAALGAAMLAGEIGHKVMPMEGYNSYVFYKPFRHTGWSVAIVCPESDIFADYYQLTHIVQLISAIGILLLVVLCLAAIWKSLEPLQTLNRAANRIAQGQYHETIPDTLRSDEIGQLQRNFKAMQQSLAGYISNVEQQTKALEQHNIELDEAYRRAQEDERVKTAVLQHMTDQMVEPVANISAIAHTICEDHQHLPDEYMSEMVVKVQEDAKKVTELLGELLHTAVNDPHSQQPQNSPAT